MKTVDYFGWKSWTKMLMQWFSRKLEAFAASFNTNTVSTIGGRVDNAKEEILAAIVTHGDDDEPIPTEEIDELLN